MRRSGIFEIYNNNKIQIKTNVYRIQNKCKHTVEDTRSKTTHTNVDQTRFYASNVKDRGFEDSIGVSGGAYLHIMRFCAQFHSDSSSL